jgi:hypothetical protein
MLGAVAEYHRRSTAERSREAQQAAIDRGVCPFPNIPPGLRVRGDKTLEPDPATAAVVVKAFKLRAGGATVHDVRRFLAANGIRRSFHAVGSLLRQRLLVGEIHFGGYEPNLNAYEPPVIDRDLFNRVQRRVVPRGRKAKTDRLLARLGVLRCGSCGARMGVSSSNHGAYPAYRCPATNDCERRMSISAPLVEGVVVDAVKEALGDVEGRASVEENVRDAENALVAAQDALDAAIRAFQVVADEPAAIGRLADLRAARDTAEARVEHLRGNSRVVSLTAARDWDRLSLGARRALVRATVESVTVTPGKGPGRVHVKLVSE